MTSSVRHRLRAHVSLLVDLPDVDGLLGLGAERGQKLIVVATESHRDPGFVMLDLG